MSVDGLSSVDLDIDVKIDILDDKVIDVNEPYESASKQDIHAVGV